MNSQHNTSPSSPAVAIPLSLAFVAWCEEKGIERFGIEAAFVQAGWRGIVATHDIKSGDIILACPAACLLSNQLQSATSSLRPHLSSQSHLNLKPIETLAVILLNELSRSQSSDNRPGAWEPYLRSLPRSYTCLCSWSESEIKALQFENAVTQARESVKAVKSSWRLVQDLMEGMKLLAKFRSFGAFLWAHQTLTSRTMYLPDDAAGCLTPYGDLFNYCPPPPPFTPEDVFTEDLATVRGDGGDQPCGSISGGDGTFDHATGRYLITARQDYRKGEQVFLCYGAHLNIELLSHYGFLIDDNSHEKVFIEIPSHLRQSGTPDQTHVKQVFLHYNGCPSWNLLKELRLLSLDRHSPSFHRSRMAIQLGNRISWQDDVKAMTILKAICLDVLSKCSSSLVEDEQDLSACVKIDEDLEVESRLTLALRWRIIQKRILKRACDRIEAMKSPALLGSHF